MSPNGGKKKPFAFARARGPKCASSKKIKTTGESVFFISPQARTTLQENAFCYDRTASGQSIYNYFRSSYDPGTGRYIEADPIGIEGGLNVYSYGLNNPLSFTDPYGLEAIPWYAPGGAVDQAGITLMKRSPIGRAASIGAMVYAACTANNSPCTPPEGTQCYEGPDTTHSHGGLNAHYHIFQMFKFGGNCQWKYLGGKVGKGVLAVLPVGMAACSTYPGFQGR